MAKVDDKLTATLRVDERANDLSPTRPGTLRRSASQHALNVAADILSAIAWAGMLVYAALLWLYHDQPFSETPFPAERFVEAARPLSTLFSTLFAATFSRALRVVAHKILETGGKVGLLDQLIGSTSVSRALTAQATAGSKGALGAHVTGIALVMLWLLSPLGSQAVLQIPSKATDSTSQVQLLTAASTEAYRQVPGGGSKVELALISLKALLNAALISPLDTKKASMDSWGHVKIPAYERLVSSDASTDWRRIQTTSADDYSSLIGIPIGNLPRGNIVSNMTLSTWYWKLDCRPWDCRGCDGDYMWQNPETLPEYLSFDHLDTRYNYTLDAKSSNVPPLAIRFDDAVNKRLANGSSSYLGNRATAACGVSDLSGSGVFSCPQLDARHVSFYIDDGLEQWYSNCSVTATRVDSEVKCDGRDCGATRMRLSPKPSLSPNWTALDYYSGMTVFGYTLISNFFSNLANAFEGGDAGVASGAISGYIGNPADPFQGITESNTPLRMVNVTDEVKTIRLSQVLNTYWLASTQSALLTGGDATFKAYEDPDNFSGFNTTKLVQANIMTPYDKLHCKIPWLVVFTLVSAFALVSSVTSCILVLYGTAPRLAMNISTLLRDSRYVDNTQARAGSHLDDSDRSRLLYDLKVRIVDVQPAADCGHVAVTDLTDRKIVGALHKDRLYD